MYDSVHDGLYVYRSAGVAVQRVRGRVRGVLLAARAELDGVVVGDVSVAPQVKARALGVLLRRAVLRHQRRQPVLAHRLQQHQTLLDQILADINVSVGINEGYAGGWASGLHVEQQLPVEGIGREGGHGLRPVVRVRGELHTAQRELASVCWLSLRAGGQRRQSRDAHDLTVSIVNVENVGHFIFSNFLNFSSVPLIV